jgi:protein gp37
MRELAESGWTIFVSIAPMIGPVTLPPDFLGSVRWAIVGGEQGHHLHVRYMNPSWARAVCDRCEAAGIPFFMKQMSGQRPIPPDLQIRQMPANY